MSTPQRLEWLEKGDILEIFLNSRRCQLTTADHLSEIERLKKQINKTIVEMHESIRLCKEYDDALKKRSAEWEGCVDKLLS